MITETNKQELTMFAKSIQAVKSFLHTVDYRLIVFVVILTLFLIGAGAPGATGIGG